MNVTKTIVTEQTKIGFGIECEVFDVGNGRCFKKYKTIENAEIACENAKRAFNADIAPEVYERGEMGYYTEIVETFDNPCLECYEDRCTGNDCEPQVMYRSREYQELCATMCKLFGRCANNDLHISNIGRKDGKLIAIDFGVCSGLENLS